MAELEHRGVELPNGRDDATNAQLSIQAVQRLFNDAGGGVPY